MQQLEPRFLLNPFAGQAARPGGASNAADNDLLQDNISSGSGEEAPGPLNPANVAPLARLAIAEEQKNTAAAAQ